MSGMEPMLIGAALGGGMSAARGGNPLTGALLGGIGGGVLGAASGAAGSASGVLPSALSGSTTVNAAALPANAVQSFTTGAPMATPLNVEAMKTAGGGLFSGGMSNPAPFVSSGTSTGMIPSSLAPPSLMDTVTGGLKDMGQFTQQNPVLTQMGSQTAQSLLQNRQPDPAGLIRGSQTQAQAPQYKIGVPQFSLI